MRSAPILAAIIALVTVGCLFPSFDSLNGSGADAGSSGQASSAGGASSSTSSSGATSEGGASSSGDASASSSGDAGASGASGKSLVCGPTACPVPANFCCVTLGGPGCQVVGTEQLCTGGEFGDIVRCDGAEDCDTGQLCCFENDTATCAATCATGKALCNGSAPCPTGKTCSATVEDSSIKACK